MGRSLTRQGGYVKQTIRADLSFGLGPNNLSTGGFPMNHQQSAALFAKAKQIIPGGVNSPVRAFKSVGCDPIFIARAEGSRIYDADGNAYIDYVGSWGPMILGHCHPKVVEAIQQAAASGASFGAPTEK